MTPELTVELISQILHRVDQLDADGPSGRVDLERSHSRASRRAPAVGYLAAGLLVGAGLALLLAPRSGRQLRAAIGARATDLKERGLAAVQGRQPSDGTRSLEREGG